MKTTKKIILCADDFAFNDEVSKTILELLAKDCISATSCMTTSPLWPQWGERLKRFSTQKDIGLHFDLTQFKPLSAGFTNLSIGGTILKAYGQQFSVSALEQECLSQLQHFSAVMGFKPHFIDGHQHVHQFPQIREAFLNACKRYFGHSKPPIRLVNGTPFLSPLRDSPLKLLIHALGRNAFKQQLDTLQWPYYPDFKGIYIFKGRPNIASLFKQFIRQIAPGGLIMCHPGHQSDAKTDSIHHIREQEYAFLNSQEWQTLREAESIQLCRYQETV